MTYAYYRKLSGQKIDLYLQQISQWADKHGMQIDGIYEEDFVTQKTPFEKRILAQKLLPQLKGGDLLIVSQLSCLGHSAAELDILFSKILKEKFIRVVCLPIDLDIDFANLTPSDELTLEKIAYAARLQGFLAHEITESALALKKTQGKKLGASSDAYKLNYSRKSTKEKDEIGKRKSKTRRIKYFEGKEVQAFIKVLENVFPDETQGEIWNWRWNEITTKDGTRQKVLGLMRDIHDFDNELFAKWDFGDLNSRSLQQKLSLYIFGLRKRVLRPDSSHVIMNAEKNIKKRTQNIIHSNRQQKFEMDESQLNRIEQDTKVSQKMLSEIFDNNSVSHEKITPYSLPNEIQEIMSKLLSKEVWAYGEVESMCKQHGLMIGFVLEQINEYSYSIVEDIVVNEDGNNISVLTDYKEYLI